MSRPFGKALKWKKEKKIFSYFHVHFPTKAGRLCLFADPTLYDVIWSDLQTPAPYL